MPTQAASTRPSVARAWQPHFIDGEGAAFKAGVSMAVVALHVLFFQLLGHEPRGSATDARSRTALRIEFIEAVRSPVLVALPPPESQALVPKRRTVTPANADKPKTSRTDATVPSASPSNAPLVMDWKVSGEAETSYRMNLPDAATSDALAFSEPDRMQVRRKVTGQDVVEGVAQALGFWPAGYESDPCPRVQRNIGNLMTDTSADGRAQLNEELRRQKVSCRQ